VESRERFIDLWSNRRDQVAGCRVGPQAGLYLEMVTQHRVYANARHDERVETSKLNSVALFASND